MINVGPGKPNGEIGMEGYAFFLLLSLSSPLERWVAGMKPDTPSSVTGWARVWYVPCLPLVKRVSRLFQNILIYRDDSMVHEEGRR